MRLRCAAEGAQPAFVNEAACAWLFHRALFCARGKLLFAGLGADGVGSDGAVERVTKRRDASQVTYLLPDEVSQRAEVRVRVRIWVRVESRVRVRVRVRVEVKARASRG